MRQASLFMILFQVSILALVFIYERLTNNALRVNFFYKIHFITIISLIQPSDRGMLLLTIILFLIVSFEFLLTVDEIKPSISDILLSVSSIGFLFIICIFNRV